MHKFLITAGVAAALALMATQTRGNNLALESFDYSVGTLQGDNGGAGFSGPWVPGGFNASNHTNYQVAAGSLPFGTLATAGNHATTASLQAISGLTRGLSTAMGTPGTTEYLSVELRPEGTLNAGVFNGFFGLYLNASTGTDLFVGKPGAGAISSYVLEDRGGSNQHSAGFTPVVGAANLLVVRADFAAGNDKFTLYVDPSPGGTEPLTGTVKQDSDVGTVSALMLYSTGAFSVDEIRIGTTYADVTSTPEPSSIAFVGVLGFVACGRLMGRHAECAGRRFR
ncbi:MAG: hypothetical protein JWO87_709 [Phycisphaerales bacterium]|nr:hypothetical protein [Phycisphaerales bacterium]